MPLAVTLPSTAPSLSVLVAVVPLSPTRFLALATNSRAALSHPSFWSERLVMFSLYWMPDPDTHRDEIFTLASSGHVENLFRKDCVKGLAWTCDGDGWTSERVERVHGLREIGEYYVSRF